MCVRVVIPSILNAGLHLSVYSVWAHQPGSHRRKANTIVFFLLGGGNDTLAHIIVCYIIAAVWRACVCVWLLYVCRQVCIWVLACLCVRYCSTCAIYVWLMRCARACACNDVSGGGGVCSAQHFAVLLLACYPSTMNEVQRNDRSRSFFWSVLQVDPRCLPVQVDIRALHFSSIH